MEIGIIAEEISDVDVIYEFTCKLTNERNFSFKKFVGHGCGMLRRKCKAWAENLILRGCKHLIIAHDLDDNNETKLRRELNNNVKEIGFEGRVILIPIREIEAWLLTDADALQNVFNMPKKPKIPSRPELVDQPKEKLKQLVWNTCKKHYINTIHNKKIAAASEISKINVCKSFQPYPEFITEYISS